MNIVRPGSNRNDPMQGTHVPAESASLNSRQRRARYTRKRDGINTTNCYDINTTNCCRNRKEWTRTLQKSVDGNFKFVWRHRIIDKTNHSNEESAAIHGCPENNGKIKNTSYHYATSIAPLREIIVIPTRTSTRVASNRAVVSTLELADTVMRLEYDHQGNHEFLNIGTPLDAHAFASLSASAFPTKYAHFVTTSASLLGEHLEKPRVTFRIPRDRAYIQSMAILSKLPTESLRSRLSIEFEGESGIDAGGLLRDWLTVMSEGLVGSGENPSTGSFDAASESHRSNVFEVVDAEDVAYHLRSDLSHSVKSSVEFALAAGRFVGRTLLEGYPLGFHLSLPLLKMMVGVPMSFSDLEFFDSASFHSLSWLLENNGVDALDLDFTVTDTYEIASESGEAKHVMRSRELIAGGADMEVTDSNKREFVSLKSRDLMIGRVEQELGSFLKGVYEVVPAGLLALFDPEEMDYLVSGSDEIDVEDWRRNTKYSENLHGHMAMRWFWEFVEEMPTEYRRRLLRFSTGSSRVPLGGFAALTSYDGKLCPFTLMGVSYRYSSGYIRSHACFNRLDLPLYVDREDLKRVLYNLLEADDTIGFTMQ